MAQKTRAIIAISLAGLGLVSLLVYGCVVNRLSVPLFWLGDPEWRRRQTAWNGVQYRVTSLEDGP